MKIQVYLAVPYSHEDPKVCEWRFERVTEAMAALINLGFDCVYSPITHTHPVDKHLTLRNNDHAFWVDKFDLPFLANSERLIVLTLPDWEYSEGVRMEIQQAKDRGIPVFYAAPEYDAMFRITAVNLTS